MSDVYIAFYKSQSHVFNRAVSWWTRGPYSHVELVVNGVWYSSSFRDGGVRAKKIDHDPNHWDLIPAPWIDVQSAVDWFHQHMDLKYDVLGLVGFVARRVPDSRHMYFCSEAVAASIGFDEPWRLDPNTFATIIRQRAVEHG